jgi:hypothetical protein
MIDEISVLIPCIIVEGILSSTARVLSQTGYDLTILDTDKSIRIKRLGQNTSHKPTAQEK